MGPCITTPDYSHLCSQTSDIRRLTSLISCPVPLPSCPQSLVHKSPSQAPSENSSQAPVPSSTYRQVTETHTWHFSCSKRSSLSHLCSPQKQCPHSHYHHYQETSFNTLLALWHKLEEISFKAQKCPKLL